MAEGNFFSRLFGLESTNHTEREGENQVGADTETNLTDSIQDAISFVAELQSYYYNDVCKMQTDLVMRTSMTEKETSFLSKKIKQEQVALSQIDEIFNLIKENEKEYQEVFKKSVYSFFEEIQSEKMETVQKKVFNVVIKLLSVNTKPELQNIILERIERYKKAWNISEEIQIPINCNAILVDANSSTEKYKFGKFTKNVIIGDNDKFLSSSQLEKIRTMDFEIEGVLATDTVWVYVSSVTRLQLNYMRRTCIIDDTWEYRQENDRNLYFDVVKVADLNQYLKGILQIVLTKRRYAVISIVVPTNDIKSIIGPTEQIEGKVKICNKYQFYMKERSETYKNILFTTRVDRRNIPEKLQFVSYLKFKKEYF